MHKILYAFLFLLSQSTISANFGKVVISGQVQNYSAKTISITQLNNRELMSSKLDASGNFKMSAKLEDGYYFLKYGRHTAYVYLYPKDKLSLTFNAKHFKNTLVFKGQGSERNNYLIQKSILDATLTKDLEAFYKADEAAYLKNIEELKNSHFAELSKYNVEDFFINEETKSLEYKRLLSIQNYKSNYKFYLGGEISPSENFYKPVKQLKLNNETDYAKQPYYRYLVNSVWNERIEAAPNVGAMIRVLRKLPFEALALSIVNGFYSKISAKNERSKDYLDLIKKVTKHEAFIAAAEKRYQEVISSKGLKPGDMSPGFIYETPEGKILKLSDLKGTYVYIDIWATWCAPCIQQVPYLKELENRYHNKNIVFVSISVDKVEVKATWKQMIIDKQLGGVQLFADKSFDSEFMNTYAVNSIPRFILIDPEGKILNPEAPRPSHNQTRDLLDELLK